MHIQSILLEIEFCEENDSKLNKDRKRKNICAGSKRGERKSHQRKRDARRDKKVIQKYLGDVKDTNENSKA
jgi:hypothetical protein